MTTYVVTDSLGEPIHAISFVDQTFGDGDSYGANTIRIPPISVDIGVVLSDYYWQTTWQIKPTKPTALHFWNKTTKVWIDPAAITLASTPDLTLTGKKDDYSVSDSVTNSYVLEVWDSLTNDRSTALLKVTPANYQPNEVRYVWARYVDVNGSYSAWTRADTNGQAVTITPLTAANLAHNLTSATPTSGNFTGFAPVISNYSQWYSVGYTEFPVVEGDYITITPTEVFEVSSVTNSATPANDYLTVFLRSYLLDITNVGSPVFVEGSLRVIKPFKLFNTKQVGALLQSQSMIETHQEGFRGLLIAGHTYRYMTDIAKVVEGGSPTCTVTHLQFSPMASFSRYL